MAGVKPSKGDGARVDGATADVKINDVVDPSLFDLYLTLRTFETKYPQAGAQLELPKLCICGEQSVGKSSLLQLYLGFPCTLVQDGTGTRCPVSYVLRYKKDCNTPRVVEPVGVSIEQLASWIGGEMKKIDDTEPSHFRDRPLSVVVEYKAYMNLELVDLPGLVEAGHEMVTLASGEKIKESALVQKMVSKFVSDPSYIVVFLRQTADDKKVDVGYPLVRAMFDQRPRNKDDDHFITIGTKLHGLKQLPSALTHLQAMRNLHTRILFTELCPPDYDSKNKVDQYFDWEKADFKRTQDYISRVPGEAGTEQAFVNRWSKTAFASAPEAAAKFDKQWRQLIGIDVIMRELRATWSRLFSQLLLNIRAKLTAAMQQATNTIRQLEQQTSEASSDKMRNSYTAYMDRFAQIMLWYLAGDARAQIKAEEIGRSWADESVLDVEDGLKDDDSIGAIISKGIGWTLFGQQARDTLNSQLDNSHTVPSVANFRANLASRACASVELQRVNDVVLVTILQHAPPPISETRINQYLPSIPGEVHTSPDPIRAAKQLMWEELHITFQDSASWLAARYLTLYNRFAKDVQEKLTAEGGEQASLDGHTEFLTLVRLAFLETVKMELIKAHELFHALLDCRRGYLNLDITARLEQTLASIPRAVTFSFMQEDGDVVVQTKARPQHVKENGTEGEVDGDAISDGDEDAAHNQDQDGPVHREDEPEPQESKSGDASAVWYRPLQSKPHACDVLATRLEVPNVRNAIKRLGLVETVRAITMEMYVATSTSMLLDLLQIFNVYGLQHVREAPAAHLPYALLRKRVEAMKEEEIHKLSLSPEHTSRLNQAKLDTKSLQEQKAATQECLQAIDIYLLKARPGLKLPPATAVADPTTAATSTAQPIGTRTVLNGGNNAASSATAGVTGDSIKDDKVLIGK